MNTGGTLVTRPSLYQVNLRLRRLTPVVLAAGEAGAAHPVPVLGAPAHRPGPPETHGATRAQHGAPGAAVLTDQRPVAPHHAGASRGDRGPGHGHRQAGEEEGGQDQGLVCAGDHHDCMAGDFQL